MNIDNVYAVSRAEKYSLAVRTGPSQNTVSNLGLNACKNRKYPNTPGGVMAKAITPLPLPTNISQLFRLVILYLIRYKNI